MIDCCSRLADAKCVTKLVISNIRQIFLKKKPNIAYLLRGQSLNDSHGDLLEEDLLHFSLQLRRRDRWDSGRDGWHSMRGHGRLPLELLGTLLLELRTLLLLLLLSMALVLLRRRDTVALGGAGARSNASRDMARTDWH